MSTFGGRSLFDGGDGEALRGDLLSDGFDVELKGDLVGEDVEGESLSRTDLIREEEGPEPEGEGELSGFRSRLAQEDEGPPDENEGELSSFTSKLSQEDEGDEPEDPDVQSFTGRFAQEDEGPEVEGELSFDRGLDSITDNTFEASRLDELDAEDGDLDLVNDGDGEIDGGMFDPPFSDF